MESFVTWMNSIDQRRQLRLNELRERRSLSGLILALGGHIARLTRSLMDLNKAFGWLTSRRRAGVLYRLTVARPRQSARQYRKVEVLSLNRGVMNLDISADS